MEKNRNAYWDNLKAALIFCVVLGHFLLPVSPKEPLVHTVFNWIYLFHMPAFVLVSGYFSRSYVRKNNKEYKLVGYVGLYVLLTVCIWAVNLALGNKINVKEILSTSSAQWYLLSMAFWLLAIPFVVRLKTPFAFFAFIALGILAGSIQSCGNFLTLSRTIVFFPFFLAGYCFGDFFPEKTKPWMRVLAALILISFACILFLYKEDLGMFLKIIYGNNSYKNLGLSTKTGIIYRFVWYIVASVMTFSVMCLIPKKRFIFTYIGERTLGIYFVHRLLRDIVTKTGMYKAVKTDWLVLLICVLISAAVVLISSAKPISAFLNRFFRMDFLIKSKSDNK